jgi:hypothetical protein
MDYKCKFQQSELKLLSPVLDKTNKLLDMSKELKNMPDCTTEQHKGKQAFYDRENLS